jgi:hypothetical protein
MIVSDSRADLDPNIPPPFRQTEKQDLVGEMLIEFVDFITEKSSARRVRLNSAGGFSYPVILIC